MTSELRLQCSMLRRGERSDEWRPGSAARGSVADWVLRWRVSCCLGDSRRFLLLSLQLSALSELAISRHLDERRLALPCHPIPSFQSTHIASSRARWSSHTVPPGQDRPLRRGSVMSAADLRAYVQPVDGPRLRTDVRRPHAAVRVAPHPTPGVRPDTCPLSAFCGNCDRQNETRFPGSTRTVDAKASRCLGVCAAVADDLCALSGSKGFCTMSRLH
jgi:hypothetical protein